jgi:SAM-dependent methyltransferase
MAAVALVDEHAAPGSAPYRLDNLLDRLSNDSTLEHWEQHLQEREQQLIPARLGLTRGDVLSVGCGRRPGRHLFPAPAFRIVGVDADPACMAEVMADGRVDEGFVGSAGSLGLARESFDVVLYRLALHHVAFQGPLQVCFAEAARLLRPGGTLIAIEPGLWHPIGLGLALANRLGIATAVHGTPDDIPLSPRGLCVEARAAGLLPELYALEYGWRRLPARLQRALERLDELGTRRRAAMFGHTVLLIARKPCRGLSER